jgi:hypothetical protein
MLLLTQWPKLFFCGSKSLPQTAKKFVVEVFDFFASLSDDRIQHHPCKYPSWKTLSYCCVTYKKYSVAYLYLADEIIICEFVASKLINW